MLKHAGGSVRVRLSQNAYVGLAVCAHVRGRPETARFSNVELTRLNLPPPATTGYGAPVESALEVLNVTGGRYGPGNRRVVRYFPAKIEAPNWSRDGRTLIYNSGGLIYRIPVEGGEPSVVNTGPLRRNNNDHGVSPDGTQLIVSDQSEPDDISRIYILPIEGSDNPRRVVSHATARSYWHAWSPDGRTIAYTASRPEIAEGYDIYARNLTGGRERRLTRHPGLDDGPDFSPDGQYIYFNSTRSGNMKIWRMRADGSYPEQVTFDEDTRDWFPHPSPDGRWLAFVSFGLDIDVNDHPPNRDVALRIMPMDGSAPPRVVARLFGGQGTINVPSWSPDSTQLAFVSYRLVR
jgi:Tol biopolymer transport system component